MSPAPSLALRLAHAAAAIAAGAAAFAMLLGTRRLPPPPVHEQTFRLVEREPDVPGAERRLPAGEQLLRVTPAKPLLLPYVFGDCDLLATVTLPANGELDLALRKLDLAGGHGRFSVLRLSASAEAPPWRTREQALFAASGGGVRVTAGLPASIRLELRGTHAAANVAGRWLPPFSTTDGRGGFAFVVRGGDAEVSHLQIAPLRQPRPALWPYAVAALLGAVGAFGSRGGARVRAWLGLTVLPLGAWGLRMLLRDEVVVGAELTAPAVLALIAALAVVALALARPGSLARTVLRLLLALAITGGLLEVFARLEAPRLLAGEDRRLDLLFGVDSHTAPFAALALQLHGKNEVHTAEPELARVVFLGGEPLFEANLDRAQHLAVQATARAAQDLGRKLVPAVFPTLYPHTLQQTEMFRRFYADAYPAVAVVLGVDRWEAQLEGEASARTRLALADASAHAAPLCHACVLVRRRFLPRAMIAPPEELRATLAEFASFCAERRLPLLLATHALLPAAHRAVVEAVARERGLPLLHAVMTADERAQVDALAAAIVAALR